MLKSVHFLSKSLFFNTIIGFSSLLVPFSISAQVSEHGAHFEPNKNAKDSSTLFESIRPTDSLDVQVKGTITEVCQAKGCWMKVNLSDDNEVFVRFKDYGFFVPTDSAGKGVVMNGLAFVEEMSVEDQRHYAIDKGATEEEANQITLPKRTLRFEADGVRIENR